MQYVEGQTTSIASRPPAPPQSQEAEESVIGRVLVHARTFNDVAEFLTPEDFYHPALKAIFEAMSELERGVQAHRRAHRGRADARGGDLRQAARLGHAPDPT